MFQAFPGEAGFEIDGQRGDGAVAHGEHRDAALTERLAERLELLAAVHDRHHRLGGTRTHVGKQRQDAVGRVHSERLNVRFRQRMRHRGQGIEPDDHGVDVFVVEHQLGHAGMRLVVRAGIDVQRVLDRHQLFQLLGDDKLLHGLLGRLGIRAEGHGVLVGLERIRHAHGFEAGSADRAEALAPDDRLAERFRQQDEVLKFREVPRHDRARLPDAGLTDHIVPGERGRVPAGGVFALGRPARLVENHLLVVADGLTHGLGELEPVKVLEAFGIHGDHVHFLGIHEVAHHVPERQVGLVAHRNQIGRAHFRGLAEPVQQEGPALADDGGAADRIGLVVRHLGGGDEPCVEFAGPGNDAHAVRPEKRRAAVAAGGEALVGFVDAGDHARGHVAAFLGFPEAAGDEHHGVRGVVLDDVVDQRRHLFRADGDDEQVERFGQGLDVGHAAHAAGVGFAFADDGQAVAIEA